MDERQNKGRPASGPDDPEPPTERSPSSARKSELELSSPGANGADADGAPERTNYPAIL